MHDVEYETSRWIASVQLFKIAASGLRQSYSHPVLSIAGFKSQNMLNPSQSGY